MAKKIAFNEEMTKGILKGIKDTVDAVASTLGPCGRTVLIEETQGSPTITKDGVTVAKSIEFEDKLANLGARLIKDIAVKADQSSGDGTTTSSLMALALIEEGLKSSSVGVNPIGIRSGMEKAVEDVVAKLRERAVAITTKDQITQVASISANNDLTIGSLIADAMEAIGTDGVITTTESKTTETHVEYVEGMQFDKGYISPYMVTDRDTMSFNVEDAYVLVCDKTISSSDDIVAILSELKGRPLLIIAGDVNSEALTTLVYNQARGSINVCAVKCPSFGEDRQARLEDIAILTGADFINGDMGLMLRDATLDNLGKAKSIIVTKDTTTIVDGMGDPEMIEARVKELKSNLGQITNEFQMEKVKERIAKLSAGIAVINVGATDETSLKEKKFRIEDSVSATRAAIEEGVVAGGGTAFCQIAKELSVERTDLNPAEKIGYDIVIRALDKPIKQIAENAGVSGDLICDKCKSASNGIGYNALTRNWVDMVADGIIDPVKVEINAIRNAASIASLLLTSSAAVTVVPKDPAPTIVAAGGPGMMM